MPLIVQYVESHEVKDSYSEIYKNIIPVDAIFRIIKRLVKIVVHLHKCGINNLDITQSNFEIDTQNFKPTMIAVPLCTRNDISQSEGCFRNYEDLGFFMLELINNSKITYANDLSFE